MAFRLPKAGAGVIASLSLPKAGAGEEVSSPRYVSPSPEVSSPRYVFFSKINDSFNSFNVTFNI